MDSLKINHRITDKQGRIKRRNSLKPVFQHVYSGGFSLIEVLISLTITACLVIGITQLTLHSLTAKKHSDESMISAEIASSKLEYLKSVPFESEEMRKDSEKEILNINRIQGKFLREWRIKKTSETLKRIEIDGYAENSRPKKASLVLIRSRELGFQE